MGAANIGQLVALAPSGGTVTPPAQTAPAAPTQLTATGANNSVSLTWTASSGATGYQVWRGTGSGAGVTLAQLAGAAPTGTSFTDGTAVNGTTYTYAVRAVNTAGASGNSNLATATPTAGTTTPPPTSTGIVDHGSRFVAATATATSVAVQLPVGVVAGDVALAAITARGNPTITAPGGWTLVRRDVQGTNVITQAVFRHVVGASETSATRATFTMSQSQFAAFGVVAYGGVGTATPVNGGQANVSSTSVTAPTITTTAANTRLVGFFGAATNTSFTAPTGMAERGDVASPSTAAFKVTLEGADQTLTAAGATNTKVARSAAAAANVGQLVALAP